MTLDRLIKQLQVIREQSGRGDLQVLFREPSEGFLYDEIMPFLTEVQEDDNIHSYMAFDLQVEDLYVEI